MTVLDDLLGSLEGDRMLRRWELGPRCAAVWSRGVGLASVPGHGGGLRLPRDRPARELALELARSRVPGEAALGVAALNSLLRPDEGQLEHGNAYQLILEHGAGRDVTVVGHFPFVERLRAEVRRLWVLELMPREGDLPASEAEVVIPRSDVVAITGSSLVNHTMDGLLALARGAEVLVLGPSTPLSPVLFDHGVTVLGGALVQEPDLVLDQVREGVSFRTISGARPVIWRRAGPG